MSRILFIGATQMAHDVLHKCEAIRRVSHWNVGCVAPDEQRRGICDYANLLDHHTTNPIALHSWAYIGKDDGDGRYSLRVFARNVNPQLVIVVGWSRLIPPEVLAIPPRGTVCFHAAKLPDYRGRAPIPHTILHDLGYTEMTMFYADAEADKGDIIASKGFYVGYKDDAGTLYEKHTKAIIALLDEHLDGLLAGTAPRRKQKGEGVWWEKRTPEMGEIDWGNTPVHLITALTKPYPGAFTYWKGKKFWVWSADEIVNSSHGLSFVDGDEIDCFDKLSGAIVMNDYNMLLTVSETQDGEVIPAYELAMKWGMAVGDKLGRDV